MRLAAITAEIRQGFTGADFSLTSGCSNTGARYQQGQANDPTASLRDDDDDFYKLLFGETTTRQTRIGIRIGICGARNTIAHLHAKLRTGNRVRLNWQQRISTRLTARLYPDLAASQQARAASRKLKG